MPNDRSDATLRERLVIAGKATNGPWKTDEVVTRKKDFEPSYVVKDKDGFTIVDVLPVPAYQANAAHIAASSPDVVREDIEEILRLRGENKLLNSMVMSFAGKAVHETVGGWWTGWKGEKFLTKKAAIMSLIVKVKSELK